MQTPQPQEVMKVLSTDFNSEYHRLHQPRFFKHNESLRLLNHLAIDLKKRELGLEHEPITIERIDDVMRKVREDMEGCWEYMVKY